LRAPLARGHGRHRHDASCSRAPPRQILIGSDLHLGPGWDAITETCVAAQNFLADRAFAAWLAYHRDRAPETLLVLNGDIFDMLRITAIPQDGDFDAWAERLQAIAHPKLRSELRDSVSRTERRYGLRTDDYKTVWRLLVLERGHPIFIDALVERVAAGGRVLLLTGNHDVEMYWPMVHDHVRSQLAGRRTPPAEVVARITFEQSWIVIDNLYIEHGHQYEAMTRVDGAPTLAPEHREINLPLGSFVNRWHRAP
jgi:hypothetical protein